MKALGKGSIAWVLGGLLTAFWWLALLAGAAVVAVFTVALITGNPADDLLDVPVDFELDPNTYRIESTSPERSSATIRGVSGMLAFETTNRPVIAAYLTVALVMVAVLLFVIHQLRLIFRSLADGTPFSPANASRIRSIGLVVIFGEVAESLAVFVSQLYVKSAFVATGVTIESHIDLEMSSIFGGMVLLVVAEVFRLGAEMQEDRELTV